MKAGHLDLMDRRHGERRLHHECHDCPANGVQLGTRARMLPPLIAVLSVSAVFAAGWVAGQARISERSRFHPLDAIALPYYGPPAPVSVREVP